MDALPPLVELHCHLEGAAYPALVRERMAARGQPMPAISRDDLYHWDDFTDFLAVYDQVAAAFQTAADYAALTYDYLTRLARDGAIYAEFFISPDHAAMVGLNYGDMLSGIAKGVARAEADFAITCRLIAICLRHKGPERALRTATLIAEHPHPLVTGFGMAGDERRYETRDFAPAFARARQAGLGLTAHAGEWGGAQTVRETLDHLGVSRIGHGVQAIDDPDLVKRLVAERIHLEICPGSNIALRVYPDYQAHPVKPLHDAGVSFSLSSDDPPFFATSLGAEYRAFASHTGLGRAALFTLSRAALQAAFLDAPTRQRLMAKLDAAG